MTSKNENIKNPFDNIEREIGLKVTNKVSVEQKKQNERMTRQTEAIEQLTNLFMETEITEAFQIHDEAYTVAKERFNQLNKIIDSSNGFENYWIAWLFQQLEDKALTEINKLLIALQVVEHIDDLKQLGVPENIIKQTAIYRRSKSAREAGKKRHSNEFIKCKKDAAPILEGLASGELQLNNTKQQVLKKDDWTVAAFIRLCNEKRLGYGDKMLTKVFKEFMSYQ